MKKVVMFLMMMAVSPLAFAETVTTSGTVVPNHTDPHTHTVDIPSQVDETRQRWGYGLGVDVVLYKPQGVLDEVTAEGRYDIHNRETRGFVVAKVDPYKLFNK